MNCAQTKHELSGYLDDVLESGRAREVRRHLETCRACAAEAEGLEKVRRLVRARGRAEVPAGLALRLRVALSQQANLRLWERLLVRLDNFLRPLAIPATAGLLATVLSFGVLIHTFAGRTVAAQPNDVPLNLTTPPRLRATAPITFNTGEEGMWVETAVDEQGRIVDFRVLYGPLDPGALSELRHVLVFTEFAPATYFGKPTSGRTVINFKRISVKG